MREVNYDERWKVARDLACKINLWPTVENLRHLDAALRRAKAEGMRAAIDGATSLKASVANGIPPHERVGFVRACNELIGYAKARAAQIEEGE